MYDKDGPGWTSVKNLTQHLSFTNIVAETTAEHLDLQGVSRKWSREIVESFTRVNYGQVRYKALVLIPFLLILLQNVDEIHMLEGACSLAATGASSVKGGNFQIFKNFLDRSGAKVHLNTTVCSIRSLYFYRF